MIRYPDLQNKGVVVTGGASGIGLATAERFAREGAQVVIFDIDPTGLEEAACNPAGFVGALKVDVSRPEEVEQGFREAIQLTGQLDILVANAGISVRSPFADISWEQWRRVMGINLDGVFLCAQEAAKHMLPQREGVILITASTNGTEGHPFYTDYNASKAGVILLCKTMALELAPSIRVNAVCPGYVLTPMQKAEYTPEMLEATNQKIPMKRHAEPEEIAGLFAFLASSEGRYITGAAIPIDGGETAGLP
ncbi:MAG: oxidoreductase [Dethiosulfovibrio peptidovorans]|nr:MAG: oxidoreductase [Dethiosulfovibrio peptidovorans]